jgi:hypothetical protein
MPWKEIDEITLDNRLTERQKETNIVTTMWCGYESKDRKMC